MTAKRLTLSCEICMANSAQPERAPFAFLKKVLFCSSRFCFAYHGRCLLYFIYFLFCWKYNHAFHFFLSDFFSFWTSSLIYNMI